MRYETPISIKESVNFKLTTTLILDLLLHLLPSDVKSKCGKVAIESIIRTVLNSQVKKSGDIKIPLLLRISIILIFRSMFITDIYYS
jgi:hypothetical protein